MTNLLGKMARFWRKGYYKPDKDMKKVLEDAEEMDDFMWKLTENLGKSMKKKIEKEFNENYFNEKALEG